ncbi:MAG: amidohydrolase family protein [Candidatus Limnocylindria bacterium]
MNVRPLVDWHTHVWLPEHLGRAHEEEMVARTGRSTRADPEAHQAAVSVADRFVVVGIRWGRLGANVPNEFIADYVRRHPARAVGLACVDPNEPTAARELARAVEVLGLRGVKLSPVYQGFDPWSKPAWTIYEMADEMGIPIMFHQAGAFASQAVLEHGNPILIDKVARSFPRLRIILAHLGQPWIEETIQLLRKHKTVFADLSASLYRHWQLYNALQLALDYHVTGQLLFGSDFPMQSTADAAATLRAVNDFGTGVTLPHVPEEVIEGILCDRPLSLLGW